jgi:hypothetical protein
MGRAPRRPVCAAHVDHKFQLAAAREGIDPALAQKTDGVEIGTGRQPVFLRDAARHAQLAPVRPSARMAASSCSAVGAPALGSVTAGLCDRPGRGLPALFARCSA